MTMRDAQGRFTKSKRSFEVALTDINKAIKEVHNIVPMALKMIGEEIMTDVKDSRAGHGVPVDKGVLRSTGAVKGPTEGVRPSVELSFGGAAAPYALIQHEATWYHHRIGESRYLVRGVQRWKQDSSHAFAQLKVLSQKALKQSKSGGGT